MLKDILKESWAFQEIMQEGREEGLEKGLQEGREKGLQEGRKVQATETLLFYIQARFPALVPLAKQQCMGLETPDQVETLMRNVILSQTEDEILHHLLAVSKE